MIKIRRGQTQSWRNFIKPLADGQPGYDREKHKIKVGDGETMWSSLPYASGLSAEEILSSEEAAKEFKAKDPIENSTLITYGTEFPNKETIGKLYLQYYSTEPEIDYVIENGAQGGWHYRKWHKGFAECWGTFKVSTSVQMPFEDTVLYSADLMLSDSESENLDYPISFIVSEPPVETATLLSSSGIAWLASKEINTYKSAAKYLIISPHKQNSTEYYVNLYVKGFWK